MAKGQHLSRYQQGIVNRYYDNKDTIVVTRLAEIVSDLALCDSEKKAAALWKRAETALAAVKADPVRSRTVLGAKDVKGLAALVGELSAKR
ncbi:MAG: hypothetical protein IBJ10_06900 [Phycisphaerales bacterium]|nr:hypothetical protein [Phycisphaerales bacterium]